MRQMYHKISRSRYERGLQIAAEECKVRHIEGTVLWKVQSQTVHGKEYNVVVTPTGIQCDCPDYLSREQICKHCYAVIIRETGGVTKHGNKGSKD